MIMSISDPNLYYVMSRDKNYLRAVYERVLRNITKVNTKRLPKLFEGQFCHVKLDFFFFFLNLVDVIHLLNFVAHFCFVV